VTDLLTRECEHSQPLSDVTYRPVHRDRHAYGCWYVACCNYNFHRHWFCQGLQNSCYMWTFSQPKTWLDNGSTKMIFITIISLATGREYLSAVCRGRSKRTCEAAQRGNECGVAWQRCIHTQKN